MSLKVSRPMAQFIIALYLELYHPFSLTTRPLFIVVVSPKNEQCVDLFVNQIVVYVLLTFSAGTHMLVCDYVTYGNIIA